MGEMLVHQVREKLREPALLWTESWYLLGVALAGFVAVGDVIIGWNLNNGAIKHFPLILTLPALYLHFVGRQIFERKNNGHGVVAVAWPLLLLAIYVIAGSLYARNFENVQETFLILGMNLFFVFFSASMLLQASDPIKLVRAYFRILLVISFLVAGAVLLEFGGTHAPIHEKEFLVIPMAVFFLVGMRNPLIRWLGVIFFLSIAVLGQKNTAYLVGLFVFAYVILILFRSLNVNSYLVRFVLAYLMLVIILMVFGGLTFLIMNKEQYLQSGNPTYRLYQYSLAWDAFLDSPIWGNGFTGNSGQVFTLWVDPSIGTSNLPTHNDVLDIAKNGGSIAVILWGLGLYRIGRVVYQNVFSAGKVTDWRRPYMHALTAMSLAAIIVYFFNPLLLKPGISYLIWSNLGLLLGMALLSDTASQQPLRKNDRGDFTK